MDTKNKALNSKYEKMIITFKHPVDKELIKKTVKDVFNYVKTIELI